MALKAMMEEYAQQEVKNLTIPPVSQRSELLLAYEKFHNTCDCDSCQSAITEKIGAFLSQ